MRRLALILLLCLFAGAGTAGVLDDAERSILDGHPRQAIALAEPHRPANRTETLRRLLILGVAYNRLGRPDMAVRPLARLVALVPDNAAFRLELASALIRSNQMERARYHLERARGAGLAPEVQARVEAALNRIEAPKPIQGYFRFAIVPESNPGKRTAAETITIGGLAFGVSPASRAQAATGVELGAGLAAMPRLSDRLHLRLSGDATGRFFPTGTPDDVMLRGGIGLVHVAPDGGQIMGEIYHARRWLDRQTYSTSLGAGLSYSRLLGQSNRVNARLERERIEYAPGFEVNRTGAQVMLSHARSSRLLLRFGLRAEHRESAYRQAAGTAWGATVGGDYLFDGGLRVGLDLAFDKNAYDGLHPLFGVSRTDRRTAAVMQFTNQNWSYRGFAPVLRIAAERQKSSIVLNTYDNLSLSIGATRAF